jgi:putative transposase
MQIFLDDQDYYRFLVILDDVIARFEVECWHYCIMPNHYHLTLCPRRTNFSDAMRHLNARYAEWWNYRHRRVGHVFQGRFKDQIVDTDQYLLVLCRYIAMNPVRARLTEHPSQWRWSSFAATVGQQAVPRFLTVEPVLKQFATADEDGGRARYARFVLAAANELDEDRIRSNARILGDETFRKKLASAVPERGARAGSDHGLTPSTTSGA